MIDAREGQVDRNYGYHWARYASLGVKALIVSHSDGLDKIRWTEVAGTNSGMVSSVPINYVRAAASPTIFNYLGKHVRLRLRVEYENTPNRTLVGVLKADQPAREAVVIFSSYGASSILPDSAPGTLQAISPAVQLQVLKGLRSYRSSLKRDVIFISTGARFMAEEGSSNLIRILQINRTKGNFRPHYLAPLKELCNRKFKSRFIAELEGNGSARAVGHQERVLVESLEVLNHDLLQMRGIVCGWE